jgi:hypothetical protein
MAVCHKLLHLLAKVCNVLLLRRLDRCDSGLTKGQTLLRDSAMEVVGPQLQNVYANGELAVAS